MTTLLPPTSDALVVRRARSTLANFGKWHFVKDYQSRKGLCGELISGVHHVEYSTLEKVKAADLCSTCWPFGKEDHKASSPQMELFALDTVSRPA